MKKSTKFSLIISLSFIVIGSIMFALGLHYSSKNEINQLAEKSNYIDFNLDDFMLSIGKKASKNVDFSKNAKISSGDFEASYDSKDIESINVEIGVSKLVLNDSNDNNIHVSLTGIPSHQIYVDSSTLIIKGDGASINNKYLVEISIPGNVSFDEININAGAADLNCKNLTCEDFILELGAGEARINSLSVDDSSSIKLSAGDLEISSANINDCDIELSMGNLVLSGLITGDLSIECGMGNTELSLDDAQSDHNYNLEAGMGNISLNGDQKSGFDREYNLDNNADSDFEIECGMGNIEINFAK